MEQNSIKSPVKVVVVGDVDDGKSTLIGRLLYETNSLPEGKIEELKSISSKRNMQMEWSFILDAFQLERDQAITVDTTQIWLKSRFGNILLVDAPGHIEFLKNMVSGAAEAQAALLLVDSLDGVQEQTKRHNYLLNLLGIKKVAVLVNKMDLVGFCTNTFNNICLEIKDYVQSMGVDDYIFIPISARNGDMLVNRLNNMSWYNGVTVLEFLESLSKDDVVKNELRLPVQDIYKFGEQRIIVGRIESGSLRVGDEVLFSPSNQIAKVLSIESWNTTYKSRADAGESVGITLDKQLFIRRGNIISDIKNPPLLTDKFYATLFWLSSQELSLKKFYKIRICTQEVQVTVESIQNEIDVNSLQKNKVDSLKRNQCGEVIFRLNDVVALDEYQNLCRTGRFVLLDSEDVVGGGMVTMKDLPNLRKTVSNRSLNITQVSHYISREAREESYGHQGGVLWLTGLSGAGKSTLAMGVEKLLFTMGYKVYALDGDNIRAGLNANLSFSSEDRTENIRRIGEVSSIITDAGFICIAAFISPYKSHRELLRNILPAGKFHEVYINASLEICANRDPKGLYKKAKMGEIANFTGISDPYEIPEEPELVINTGKLTIEECINKIVDYVVSEFSLEKIFSGWSKVE